MSDRGKYRARLADRHLLEAAEADWSPGLQVEGDVVVQEQRAFARRRRALYQRQSPCWRRGRIALERRVQVLEHLPLPTILTTSEPT